MVASWHELIEQEARIFRQLNDAAAFAYLTENCPPGDLANTPRALGLIGRRPWRKQFHIRLANQYLPDVRSTQFQFAIRAFMTFMKAEALSRILWDATQDSAKERHFAGYYFYAEVGHTHGKDHPALKRWSSGSHMPT